MSPEEFVAIMPYISTDVIAMIVRKLNICEQDAISTLYNSQLYATLE